MLGLLALACVSLTTPTPPATPLDVRAIASLLTSGDAKNVVVLAGAGIHEQHRPGLLEPRWYNHASREVPHHPLAYEAMSWP